MEKFEKDVINLMESIGFTLHIASDMNGTTKMHGTAYEYKYYPEYFTDKHYTLVLFSNVCHYYENNSVGIKNIVDHRLYIHKNLDGSFHGSPYQIESSSEYNQRKIIEEIGKIFSIELRDKKLNELIYEN